MPHQPSAKKPWREREREFTERSRISNSTHSYPAKLKAVSKTDDKLLKKKKKLLRMGSRLTG